MAHEDLKENWSNISRDASDITLQTLQYVLYMQTLFTDMVVYWYGWLNRSYHTVAKKIVLTMNLS